MAKQYIIWGSGGHGLVLADIIEQQGGKIALFIDNNAGAKPAIKDIPLVIGEEGFKKWAALNNASDYYGLVAIGGHNGKARLKIQDFLHSLGVKFEVLAHSAATISPKAKIAEGSQILAQAVIASGAVLGKNCIINHKASVDHETVLGNGVHLAPNATLCGLVELGDNVMVAAGATILPRIKIGANTLVGAGSVVTRDLPEGVIAYGNPAKVIRKI